MGIDDQIHMANPNYRFYSCDSSIEGRHSVWLTLKGQARNDWFLQGEILSKDGTDLRLPLHVTACDETFEKSLLAAIEKIKVTP